MARDSPGRIKRRSRSILLLRSAANSSLGKLAVHLTGFGWLYSTITISRSRRMKEAINELTNTFPWIPTLHRLDLESCQPHAGHGK